MSDDWFTQVAKAVRAREVAVAGLARWQEKVTAAEQVIQELYAQRDAPISLPTAADHQEEIAAAIPSPFQPAFGITSNAQQH